MVLPHHPDAHYAGGHGHRVELQLHHLRHHRLCVAGFGAAFGPLMLFSLFWKRTTRAGAIAGMVAGGTMVFFWRGVLKPLGGVFGLYELLPAFLFSALVIVVVSLLTQKPNADMDSEFDRVKAGEA